MKLQFQIALATLLGAALGGNPIEQAFREVCREYDDLEALAREFAAARLGLRRVCNGCGNESGHWLEPDDPYITFTVLCDACQAKNGYENNMDLLKGVDLDALLSKARAAGLEV
mgnify:FL=1